MNDLMDDDSLSSDLSGDMNLPLDNKKREGGANDFLVDMSVSHPLHHPHQRPSPHQQHVIASFSSSAETDTGVAETSSYPVPVHSQSPLPLRPLTPPVGNAATDVLHHHNHSHNHNHIQSHSHSRSLDAPLHNTVRNIGSSVNLPQTMSAPPMPSPSGVSFSSSSSPLSCPPSSSFSLSSSTILSVTPGMPPPGTSCIACDVIVASTLGAAESPIPGEWFCGFCHGKYTTNGGMLCSSCIYVPTKKEVDERKKKCRKCKKGEFYEAEEIVPDDAVPSVTATSVGGAAVTGTAMTLAAKTTAVTGSILSSSPSLPYTATTAAAAVSGASGIRAEAIRTTSTSISTAVTITAIAAAAAAERGAVVLAADREPRTCLSPKCQRKEQYQNGVLEIFPVCDRCRLAAYCSKECQSYHWRAGHGAQCKPMVPPVAAVAPSAPPTPAPTEMASAVPPTPSHTNTEPSPVAATAAVLAAPDADAAAAVTDVAAADADATVTVAAAAVTDAVVAVADAAAAVTDASADDPDMAAVDADADAITGDSLGLSRKRKQLGQ